MKHLFFVNIYFLLLLFGLNFGVFAQNDKPQVVNPLESSMEVVFVGAYGDKSTGKVQVIFKAKNKTYEKTSSFGMYSFAAFDKNGKTYSPQYDGYYTFETPKDLWVQIRLSNHGTYLEKVPETVTALVLINVYCNVDGKKGDIEFRNIPVQWGVAPE